MRFGWRRREDRSGSESTIQEIDDPAEIVAAETATVVLFKHSHRCGLSFRALRQVQRFAAAHPDVRILMVDVVREPTLSRFISERFAVTHRSPQAIVVRGGKPIWDASHHQVTADGLEIAVFEPGA